MSRYKKFTYGLFFGSFLVLMFLGWGTFLSLLMAGVMSLGIQFSMNIFLARSSKGIKLKKRLSGPDVFAGIMGIVFAGTVIFAVTLEIIWPTSTDGTSSSSSSSGYSYCASVAKDDLQACMNRGNDEADWRICERDYNYMMAGCTATE